MMVSLSSADSNCLGGAVLQLAQKNDHDNKQKWRFYDNGIVNHHCGRESGNLAITEIEDNNFRDIPDLNNIEFSIVNPYK